MAPKRTLIMDGYKWNTNSSMQILRPEIEFQQTQLFKTSTQKKSQNNKIYSTHHKIVNLSL